MSEAICKEGHVLEAGAVVCSRCGNGPVVTDEQVRQEAVVENQQAEATQENPSDVPGEAPAQPEELPAPADASGEEAAPQTDNAPDQAGTDSQAPATPEAPVETPTPAPSVEGDNVSMPAPEAPKADETPAQ